MDNWKIVVAALHWNGEHNTTLTYAEEMAIRWAADGFGPNINPLTDEQSKDMFWDWSHVRDSSDAAIAEMAQRARTILAQHYITL